MRRKFGLQMTYKALPRTDRPSGERESWHFYDEPEAETVYSP